jgi:hypothetical protein
VVAKSDRAARRSDRIARWSLRRMLHFEEQRITAEAMEPVAQTHSFFRVLARPRKRQQQRAESPRHWSDTFLELTLIVGGSPSYPGCDCKRLVLRSRTTFAIAPASLL